jgi:hypothetical protein
MPARKFTDAQEKTICSRYLAGENTVQLGKAFGTGYSTINRIITRNGIRPRSNKEAHGGLTDAQEAEVCSRYLAGENTVPLGTAFGVGSTTILSVLRRNGINRRSIKEINGGLTDAQESEVCLRYTQGENCPQLGEAFTVNASTIHNVLRRNGIKLRSNKEAQGGLADAQESDVCVHYEAGATAPQLGKNFGVCSATIYAILDRNGIERRASGIKFGDSVQHVLDCTGLHAQARDSEFYLYELARYAATHCKPGIAFDADHRVDAEYGDAVLRLIFATRAEALFLEMAVLDATRGSSDCPEDLLGWGGATEIRAMPAEDMVPIVERLAAEIEELGVWEFAATYVPMSAAQRAICQQRALTGAPAFVAA